MPPKSKVQMEKAHVEGSQKKVYFDEKPNDISKEFQSWLDEIEKNRAKFKDVSEFKFNKDRVRILSGDNKATEKPKAILYWMNRDQRVQDNWAMLYAQRLGLKFQVPLHVCYILNPTDVVKTERHVKFLIKGLEIVEKECREKLMGFHCIHPAKNIVAKRDREGNFKPQEAAKIRQAEVKAIVDLVENLGVAAVVTDFSPLKEDVSLINAVMEVLPKEITLAQVDAHNVVPCWLASDKMEVGARTLRPKIHRIITKYLTEYPPVIKHPFKAENCSKVDWLVLEKDILSTCDMNVNEINWCQPGYTRAMQMLYDFMETQLTDFNNARNNPTKPALSNISPWLRFGHASSQRCLLEVSKKRSNQKDKVGVEIFIEEALVRRELADNFCFYVENGNYDTINGAAEWARNTLKDHEKDRRSPSYTEFEMENAKTQDDLWNAAQRQLIKVGKMHGFLRMYWAKKILEWHSEGPEAALRLALRLNDHYSLDGYCPNGFTGVMWSICGIHDQGWGERPIFGKIRFMNYKGCQRKFNIKSFVDLYSDSHI